MHSMMLTTQLIEVLYTISLKLWHAGEFLNTTLEVLIVTISTCRICFGLGLVLCVKLYLYIECIIRIVIDIP